MGPLLENLGYYAVLSSSLLLSPQLSRPRPCLLEPITPFPSLTFADPLGALAESILHTAPPRPSPPSPQACSASPPHRRALADATNAEADRVSSSLRAAVPQAALYDIHIAAVASLPAKWPRHGNPMAPASFTFTNFATARAGPESDRMPADWQILAVFITNATGSCTGGCIRKWFSGLRLWHLYNDAPWHGDDGWLSVLKKSADKGGITFKHPPRGPVTDERMRALHSALDLDSPFVEAFEKHWRINHSPPTGTLLFAYRSPSGWEVLTKDTFLRYSVSVFKTCTLELILGHSYPIGGSPALLTAGVVPEMIMKLGG
ncbi:hypothetical protein B0H17DRAFT_1196191 [Mycena rosella]|uniref:Uncharacterized protein n=1 Tax=Mycena rosella TaxID=1033263 RepID=A0AAD7DUX8_MYCRO|nr:hypothetical protein B0H17DRAFT_1196191 [Mycena rosella]